MDLDILGQYIEPQLLILVPMLWGIGMAVKSSSIQNRFIPLILLLSSCGVSLLHLTSTNIIFNAQGISACLFAAITQGSVIWLCAWGSYEKFLKPNQGTGNG